MIQEGGKRKIDFEKAMIFCSFLIGPLLVVYVLSSQENTAYIGRSTSSLAQTSQTQEAAPPLDHSIPVQSSASNSSTRRHSSRNIGTSLKLSAKQVLLRENMGTGNGFFAGSNFLGELQSSIDTRDATQVVRVALPYGAKSKDGSSELPKGTLLLGQVNYSGQGEKVFIQFQQAVLPDGKSLKISAQALDPKDYSTGLAGEIQSQARSRTMAVMGFSALSAMGSVLTEKEALGQYQVEAKANMKNAMLSGVSRAAEIEANRLQEKTSAEDYVTVDAGTMVVISLIQGLSL